MYQRQSQGGPLKNKPKRVIVKWREWGPKNWNHVAPSPATVISINL